MRVLTGPLKPGNKDLAVTWKIIPILVAVLIVSSLMAYVESVLSADQVSNNVSYSTPISYIQITFIPNRPASFDCLKQKKTSSLASQPHQATGSNWPNQSDAMAHGFCTASILRSSNLQQAFLLLDLPPPSTSSLF